MIHIIRWLAIIGGIAFLRWLRRPYIPDFRKRVQSF